MPAQQTQHKIPVFLTAIAMAYVWPVVLFWGASLLPSTPLFRYVLTAIGALGMLAIAFFAMRYDTVNLKALGWSSKGLRHAVELLALGWGLWAIVSLSMTFKMGRPFQENFESSLPQIVVQWLFVGIAEEVLFRGYILTRLIQMFGKLGRARSRLAGVALSSFIFATFHIPQRVIVHGMALRPDALMGQMVPLFFVGVLLAWLYLRSQNVLFVGLFHGGINAPLVGHEGSLAFVLLFLVLVEICAWRTRKTQAGIPISEDTPGMNRQDAAYLPCFGGKDPQYGQTPVGESRQSGDTGAL